MEKVKEQAGFKGTLQEFFVFMRTDKQFYLPNNDAGAQEYIDRATKHIEEMKLALPKYFGRLPKADLIVKRVEPYPRRAGRRAALSVGHAGWFAAGHLLRPPLRHERDADLHAGRHRLS